MLAVVPQQVKTKYRPGKTQAQGYVPHSSECSDDFAFAGVCVAIVKPDLDSDVVDPLDNALLLDTTIRVTKNCPVFVTQQVTVATV